MKGNLKLGAYVLALALISVTTARAQSEDEEKTSPNDAARVLAARHLTSRDALVRQRAAEELARLAATDQRKLVEGYRLQEKNERVKLALDWALYRMGKTETLFTIVRALDSPRYNQAYAYLTALDGPEPLYIFLQRASSKMEIKLLEVLARVGDAETIELIKPYSASLDPAIASAANYATREITLRLAQNPVSTRPRKAGKSDDRSP